MFSRLAPQKVCHSSGYLVQVASKQGVELIDRDGGIVHVNAEFGSVSTIYADSVRKRCADGRAVTLTEEETRLLLAQIKAGLEAMGGVYEIV